MKRVFGVAVLMCVFAWPAHADVTVKMTTTGPAMGPGRAGGRGAGTSEIPTTYYIKGGKARIDMVMAGREMSTILDPATHQMISLNPETKEAIIYDLAKLGEQMQQSVQMGDVKVSMTPTGETKQLLGRTCTGYMLSVTMPMSMGGRGGDMGSMTVTLGGPVWIAKDAPGTTDFAAFYKAAAESGFFSFGGRGGRGNPGMQERGMAAMYKAFSEAGGIPYEQEMQVKMEGAPSMPPTVTKVTSVSTDPIPVDTFQIPAGYTKKIQ
jgi:hypothetical protein